MKAVEELLAESNSMEFHTVLFDANPLPTFVLDREFCVIDFNAAASDFLDTSLSEIFRHRTGDLFQCRNAVETMAECGASPACRHCGVRNAITEAFEGRRTSRCRHQMELIRDGERARVDLLITATPFTDRGQALALLILEDVTELSVAVHPPASTRS
jgi:PAS domain-containing protein